MLNPQTEVYDALNNGHQLLQQVYKSYEKPNITNIVFTRAKSYWAQIQRKRNTYTLRIGSLFSLIPDETVARQRFNSTIVHELIHTLPGCMNHGPLFKRVCAQVNKLCPELKVQTTTSTEDCGFELEEKSSRYEVVCKHCGHIYKYARKPKYELSEYECGHCGHSDFELKDNYAE